MVVHLLASVSLYAEPRTPPPTQGSLLAQRHTVGAPEVGSSQSYCTTQVFQKSLLSLLHTPLPDAPRYILVGSGEQKDLTPLAEQAWGIQLVPN